MLFRVVRLLGLSAVAVSISLTLVTRSPFQDPLEPFMPQVVYHDTSAPLSQMAAGSVKASRAAPDLEMRDLPVFTTKTSPSRAVDSVWQRTANAPNPLTLLQSFAGIDTVHSFPCDGCMWSADLSGAVGRDYYVQTVNFAYAVYDKSGHLLLGPLPTGEFWQGITDAGGACDDGYIWTDVVVLYDHAVDRWFISRFARDPKTHYWYQCFAISTTPDPRGTYYRYVFLISQSEFNDYPKFGIWPDAYYMTALRDKIFSGKGLFVAAFERAAMLAGQPSPKSVIFQLDNNGRRAGMLPADWDGRTPPPDGAPNYLIRPLDDHLGWPSEALEIWQFHVDWANLKHSSLTLVSTLTPAPFDSALCNLDQSCIPQPGTSVGLDPIAYGFLMYRLAYRNFGDHEALVLNQTVDVEEFTNHAGIRWYELRKQGGGSWTIYQQSTYAPDGKHRFEGSITMDAAGDIALGYSASSESFYPSVLYAGRSANDPRNTLSQEATLMAGKGSQTGYVFWDDWTQMTVDPLDDCTFWYVNGYYPETSPTQDWSTVIGTLRFPNCKAP